MLDKIMGAIVAEALVAACAGNWRKNKRAEWLGRAARRALPWPLSGAAARSLAQAPAGGAQLGFLAAGSIGAGCWMAAAGWPWWWTCASAVASGALALAALERRRPASRLASGRVWLSLVSSSELCGSLAPSGSDPTQWAGPQPRQGKPWRSVGFQELAARLSKPLAPGPESDHHRQARRRLLGMALACAGSEAAARWLWRRRRAQQPMKTWGVFLADGSKAGSEAWELSNSLADLHFFARAGEQAFAMGASEASESSIPMLWCGLGDQKSSFQRQIRAEAIQALQDGHGHAQWGWRLIDGDGAVKKKIALAAGFVPCGSSLLASAGAESSAPAQSRARALLGGRAPEEIWASIAPRS